VNQRASLVGDLYAVGVVSPDPFQVARTLREAMSFEPG
jgi:hypothetical protein